MAEYHDRGWVVTRPAKNEQLLIRLVVPDGASIPAGVELQVDQKADQHGAGSWCPISSVIEPETTIKEVRT